MKLTGLHFLLTYQCTFECEHCFAWGSPWQNGVMTLGNVRLFLQQAKETPEISSIYFEGGEPFLYYGTLLPAVQMAHAMGFEVGVVTNSYWANSEEDALAWLQPFAGLLVDLSISSDLYHYDERLSSQAQNARRAAESLGIPVGYICIAPPATAISNQPTGQLPIGESGVRYRGRAAEKLSCKAPFHPWESFTACVDEDLRDPGRVHLDPFGNIHLCQGIVLGNLNEQHLADICAGYDPDVHAISGPLLRGGPAELASMYAIQPSPGYADACHLCYHTRQALRLRFPKILQPDNMYGVFTT